MGGDADTGMLLELLQQRRSGASNSSCAERSGGDAAGDLPAKSPSTKRAPRMTARTSSFSGLAILPSPRSPMARMMTKKNSKKWALPAAGQNGGDASAVA